MDRISKYTLSKFVPIFLNIFSILFLITSIIIIISISNMTSNIKISTYELFEMYILSLPRVIFIAISISFIIATTSLFSQLSETQELIALFSTGIKPIKLLNPFIVLAFLFTAINLIILFVSIPYSHNALKNFKIKKQQEAKFNFQTSQISQKFGDWSVFTDKKIKDVYYNLILYNPKEDKFIISNSATLFNKDNYLKFKLQNGVIYLLNKLSFIQYKTLFINQKLPIKKYSIFRFKEYFNRFKKTFLFYLPFALMPIALIFFIPKISFFHPRINKINSLAYIGIIIVLYTILTKISHNIFIILSTIFLTIIIGFMSIRSIKL